MKRFIPFTIFLFIIIFGLLPLQDTKTASAAACNVTSAKWTTYGEQENDWYVPGKSKTSIIFTTENCIGQTLALDIKEADTCLVANCDDSLPDSGLENKPIKIEEVTTEVSFTVGEEACEAFLGSFDCDYFFRIEDGDNLLYSSWNKIEGNLMYECDNTCLDNWKLEKISYSGGKGPVGSDGNPVSVNATGDKVFDSDYTLLAPIGNLTKIGSTTNTKVGDYLNIILLIAIGLCGALAVIMIVVRGVQYMGDESVFGKTEAKSHIMQAVLGLLLALGAYAILNTISPKLVGGTLTFNSVNIELDGTPMTSNDPVPSGGGSTSRCPEGIVTISTSGGKFPVCKSFSNNLKSMINTAWSQGYEISGYGFRTKESQINLRKKHCGGDTYYNIYQKPSNKCRPPTATPGNSMHESGLAFDLTCSGKSITDRKNKCFVWLQKNAGSYGLKNLSSEPWHWSTNGK